MFKNLSLYRNVFKFIFKILGWVEVIRVNKKMFVELGFIG